MLQIVESLKVAFRYEAFDDDIPGYQDGHLENRIGIGFTYILFEKGGFSTSLLTEYRRSNLEVQSGNPNNVDSSLHEFFGRLALGFE